MIKNGRLVLILMLLPIIGCDGGDNSIVLPTTYSISGAFTTEATGVNTLSPSALQLESQALQAVSPFSTCSDGYSYTIECRTVGAEPEAFRSDIENCSDARGFYTISQLPRNRTITCSLLRSGGVLIENLGEIFITAPTLSGESSTLTPSGGFTMDVLVTPEGRITGEVPEEHRDRIFSGSANSFFSENLNGIYTLTCDSELSDFFQNDPSLCPCLLAEEKLKTIYPSNSSTSSLAQCLQDQGQALGSQNQIVELNLYRGFFATEIPHQDIVIPANLPFQAASLWRAPGGLSTRGAGGEGASDRDGLFNWNTGGPENPVTSVEWTSGETVSVDGSLINLPDLSLIHSSSDPNQFSHDDWISWVTAVLESAEAAGIDCTQGPQGSSGVVIDDFVDSGKITNIPCANEILQKIGGSSGVLPRVEIRPFCDGQGCRLSSNANDIPAPYYFSEITNNARLFFENHRLSYPVLWQSSDDYSASGTNVSPDLGNRLGGTGLSPNQRILFSHLSTFAGGGSFQTRTDNRVQFECRSDTPTESFHVQNAACPLSSLFYSLDCYVSEQTSIRLLSELTPLESIFQVTRSVVSANLLAYDTSSDLPTRVVPLDATAISLCRSKIGEDSGATFPVQWIKN